MPHNLTGSAEDLSFRKRRGMMVALANRGGPREGGPGSVVMMVKRHHQQQIDLHRNQHVAGRDTP